MLRGEGKLAKIEALGAVVDDAREDRRIRMLLSGKPLEPPFGDVLALSPLGEAHFATAVDGRKTLKNSVNFSSIVLWIAIGEARALLGADLDEHQKFGWSSLAVEFARRIKSGELAGADLLKIPHHGSKHANRDGAAETLESLTSEEFTAVTTRNLNAVPALPDPGVILEHTERADTFIVGSKYSRRQQVGWVTARRKFDDLLAK